MRKGDNRSDLFGINPNALPDIETDRTQAPHLLRTHVEQVRTAPEIGGIARIDGWRPIRSVFLLPRDRGTALRARNVGAEAGDPEQYAGAVARPFQELHHAVDRGQRFTLATVCPAQEQLKVADADAVGEMRQPLAVGRELRQPVIADRTRQYLERAIRAEHADARARRQRKIGEHRAGEGDATVGAAIKIRSIGDALETGCVQRRVEVAHLPIQRGIPDVRQLTQVFFRVCLCHARSLSWLCG